MALCAHQYWLRVYRGESGVGLQYTNRLHHISTSLPDPTNQRPSLLFFFGKQFKTLKAAEKKSVFADVFEFSLASSDVEHDKTLPGDTRRFRLLLVGKKRQNEENKAVQMKI